MQGGRHRGPAWGFPLQETQAAPALAGVGLFLLAPPPDSPSLGPREMHQFPERQKGPEGRAEYTLLLPPLLLPGAPGASCARCTPGLAVPGLPLPPRLATARTMPFCPTRHLKRSKRLPRGKWVARVKVGFRDARPEDDHPERQWLSVAPGGLRGVTGEDTWAAWTPAQGQPGVSRKAWRAHRGGPGDTAHRQPRTWEGASPLTPAPPRLSYSCPCLSPPAA